MHKHGLVLHFCASHHLRSYFFWFVPIWYKENFKIFWSKSQQISKKKWQSIFFPMLVQFPMSHCGLLRISYSFQHNCTKTFDIILKKKSNRTIKTKPWEIVLIKRSISNKISPTVFTPEFSNAEKFVDTWAFFDDWKTTHPNSDSEFPIGKMEDGYLKDYKIHIQSDPSNVLHVHEYHIKLRLHVHDTHILILMRPFHM